MKSIYVVACFLFLTFGAYATEFGIVDYQMVIQKSKAFNSFQSQAESNKKDLESQFQKESDNLKLMEETLVKKRPEYSETEFNKRRAEFESKVDAFRTKFQTKQTEFEKNNNEALKTIEDQSKKAIAEVSKAKKLEMVYQAAALAYYDKAKDISDEVLKKLDSSLPKVSLKKVS